MAKQRTELDRRCPSPPYTRWDQRKEPVLLCFLKNIDGKSLCLSLQTQNPDIARGHMRLIVAWLLAKGHLSPDSGAAKVYGRKGVRRSWLKKVEAEVRRLKALPAGEYGPEALATATRWGRPVGIIHYLAGRKPELAAGTHATRRMRARDLLGKRFPMGRTWENRRQGGKSFFWNAKVPTARLQIDGRRWQWPLKVADGDQAETLMAPVRVARESLRQAALKVLNCELGTDAAVAAAAARTIARGQLAAAIIAVGGPPELADSVIRGPNGKGGTPSPLPLAVTLKATNQAKVKQCVEWLADLIIANPKRAPVPLADLRKQAKLKFGVTRRVFEEGKNCCVRRAQKQTKNFNWSIGGRPPG
jgi:hypothetical protein